MQNRNNRLYKIKSRKTIVNTYNSKRCNHLKNHNNRISKRVSNNHRRKGDIMYGGINITYKNGDKYSGEVLGYKKEGDGIMTYKDGSVYEGMWKDDKRSGKGKMTWPDNRFYLGDWHDDKRSGIGNMTWPYLKIYLDIEENRTKEKGDPDFEDLIAMKLWGRRPMPFVSSVYEGHWKDDKINGTGVMRWPANYRKFAIYEGEFMNGEIVSGRMTYTDGTVYEGEFKDNKKNGRGKFTNKFGVIIDCNWEDDLDKGTGIKTYPDGTVYEGELYGGIIHGFGVLREVSGIVYEGNFRNNQRNGIGKQTWPDGKVYLGEYKDNKMNGRGKHTTPDGKVYEGEWKDDKLNGRGKATIKFADFEGEWKDGILYNGIATLRFNDKTILRKIQNGSVYNFDQTLSKYIITQEKENIETKFITIYTNLHGSDLTNTNCTITQGKHVRLVSFTSCGFINVIHNKFDSVNIAYNVFHLKQNDGHSTNQKLEKIIELYNEINTNLVDIFDGYTKPLIDHAYAARGNYTSLFVIDTNDISAIQPFLPDIPDDKPGLGILTNRIDDIKILDNLEGIDIYDKLKSVLNLIDLAKTQFYRSNLINVLFNLGYETINIIDPSCRVISKQKKEYKNDEKMNYICNINNDEAKAEFVSDTIYSRNI
jgi:hypothetical protein